MKDCLRCDNCINAIGKTFFRCHHCDAKLCSVCEKDFMSGRFSDNDESNNCPYCNGKLISDEYLLDFALECLDCDRSKLEEEYRKEA